MGQTLSTPNAREILAQYEEAERFRARMAPDAYGINRQPTHGYAQLGASQSAKGLASSMLVGQVAQQVLKSAEQMGLIPTAHDLQWTEDYQRDSITLRHPPTGWSVELDLGALRGQSQGDAARVLGNAVKEWVKHQVIHMPSMVKVTTAYHQGLVWIDADTAARSDVAPKTMKLSHVELSKGEGQ